MGFENILCFAPLFIVVLWIPILLLTSRIGGWSRLAEYYQFHSEFVGQKWRPWLRYVYLGSAKYGNTLTIGANYHGLYLEMSPLFQVGHPPLLIPWNDITTAEYRGINVFLFGFYVRQSTVSEASCTSKVRRQNCGRTIRLILRG